MNRVRPLIGSLLVLCVSAVSTYSHGFNRNDVFSELSEIKVNWSDVSVRMWINDLGSDSEPGVVVGDRIVYHVEADKPAYFAFVLVGAKGSTSVLKPDELEMNGISGASESMIFPDQGGASSDQNYIEQAQPLGKETVFLVASEKPIPGAVFDLEAHSDYVDFGTDLSRVEALVSRLNEFSASASLAIHKYEYYVDSDTQFSTRGIKRAITQRVREVEEVVDGAQVVTNAALTANEVAPMVVNTPVKSSPIVMNDIKFEFDSDIMTEGAVNQMEILGSELLDRLATAQMPKVRLTGHTDASGSADYNMQLSRQRSAAAKRFLVESYGLPPENFDTYGMGESVPIESNDIPSGRARNRRVEFEVVQ